MNSVNDGIDIENLDYVEISNIQNNKINGHFKKVNKTIELHKKEILISSLTPMFYSIMIAK